MGMGCRIREGEMTMDPVYGAWDVSCPTCKHRLTWRQIKQGRCPNCGVTKGVLKAIEKSIGG